MRIQSIRIDHWRNFEGIEINLDPSASLVCVVGANGTGKSNLLHLIASSAPHFGLAPGREVARGNLNAEPHKYSITFHLATGVSEAFDRGLASHHGYPNWNRTLTLESESEGKKGTSKQNVTAGGVVAVSHEFAQQVVSALGAANDVHFVSLDSDRAYPRLGMQTQDIIQAQQRDWSDRDSTRGSSFLNTAMLYGEWIKSMLVKETNFATEFAAKARLAAQTGEGRPEFVEPFAEYSTALNSVLPHLSFSAADNTARTLRFLASGVSVPFEFLNCHSVLPGG